MNEENVERIVAYLRAHAASYDMAELQAQLLAAGYAEAEINAAVARLRPSAAFPAEGATVVLPAAAPPDTPAAPPDIPAAPPDSGPVVVPSSHPETPGDGEREVLRALVYIREHRGQYEERGLRAALVQSGYSAAAVDEAFRRLGPGPAQTAPRQRAWPRAILLAAANIVGLVVIGAIEVALGSQLIVTLLIGCVLLIGEVVAGLVLMQRPQRERLGRIFLLGALYTVLGVGLLGVVGVVLLLGWCIALLSGG